MPTVLGLSKVLTAFKKLSTIAGGIRPVVIVGYTQKYALEVHENLEVSHPIGQAKFLEQPARQMSAELARTVGLVIKSGATLEQGLLVAGLRLQRESQKLVPVDTAALKNSAFTKKE